MTADLSKLVLYTPDNAFKNVNSYSGTVALPTTLAAGTLSTTTSVVNLTVAPIFTEYFAQFLEIAQAIDTYGTAAGTTPLRWYSGNVAGGGFNIGIHVNAPAPRVGWLGASLYPVINGTTVIMTAQVFNPYVDIITFDAITVPFVFIEYELAN